MNNDTYFNYFVNIVNIYINLGHWPSHFKKLTSIIISKPNKLSSDSLKTFYLIVLLNILGKLIKSGRLQAYSITSEFIHSNQISGIKQCLITDASIFLTYLIYTSWIKGLYTSMLTFNIAQFFSSLNHQLLPKILDKAGFNLRISCFFSDFLSNRQT